MEAELESMYSNGAQDLVEGLEGIKPIRCKWVYKRKLGVDGKVETYKVILVAKDYSQIDQKVFVSTNDRFLENNYMMSNRARCDIDWKALKYTPTSAQETMGLKVYTPIIPVSFSTPVPHRSGRVVIQPDRFMYLRESSTQFHRNMRLIPQITMK